MPLQIPFSYLFLSFISSFGEMILMGYRVKNAVLLLLASCSLGKTKLSTATGSENVTSSDPRPPWAPSINAAM